MTMSPTHRAFNHVVAFEIAKDTLTVHVLPGGEQHTLANKPKTIRKLLLREMRRNAEAELGRLLVICEATGRYDRHVLEIGVELGLALHRAHGSRVRDFARYKGFGAKTDRVDAHVLALYGLEAKDLRLYQPDSPEIVALRELKTRRDQVQQMLIAETNRLEHVRHAGVRRGLQAHIASLRKSLAALEAEMAAHIAAHAELARKVRLMRSLKGVGPVTAATMLACMPQLGSARKGEAARLAGVAPMARDSGKWQGPRHIEAGRAKVRVALYMAALVAIRHNPVMRSFAASLRQNGKPFKVVLTAVMRKLIVTLNAILRSGQPWRHAQQA
jgi:transposase